MRAHFVVVAPPARNLLARVAQRQEPVLVEALIPEPAVETLYVRILRRAARIVQNMPDAMRLRPCHECAAGKFRALIRADRFWIPAELHTLIQ